MDIRFRQQGQTPDDALATRGARPYRNAITGTTATMQTRHGHRRASRAWRWGIGLAVAATLLGAWWLAVDRVAARIGLDAAHTLRELPRSADVQPRND